MAEAGLSLGSNVGDKAAAIEEALRRLQAHPDIEVVRRSRLYRTAPWGDENQDWFLNACAIVDTGLAPRALLDSCLTIETGLGRDRYKSRKWGPRPIDIDVLFFGEESIQEPGLSLPHPHLFERAFVLVPLAEIAEDKSISDRKIADAVRTVDSSSVCLWKPES